MKPAKTGKNKGQTLLTKEGTARILSVALRRMVMIGGNVYGLEDAAEPDADVDCAARTENCKAVYCTYAFALTQEEFRKGFYRHNTERPFYMARDADGYCPYLDRGILRCSIHDSRSLRCRRYACKKEVTGG